MRALKNRRVLVFGSDFIVIPHERVENSHLVPAGAQFKGGVAREAADIGAYKRYSEQVKVQDSVDGESHVVIGCMVITEPVTCKFTAADKCRPGDDWRSSFGEHGVQNGSGDIGLGPSVHVVKVLMGGQVLSARGTDGSRHQIPVNCPWCVRRVVQL